MADGTGGSVGWNQGYDEPPGDGEGTNHSFTDYAQQLTVKRPRSDAFEDGKRPQ